MHIKLFEIMTRKLLVLVLLFLSLYTSAFAQTTNAKRIRVSGYIYDLKSKESLIGATFLDVNSKTVTTSNNYGFYSTSIPEGKTDIFQYRLAVCCVADVFCFQHQYTSLRIR